MRFYPDIPLSVTLSIWTSWLALSLLMYGEQIAPFADRVGLYEVGERIYSVTGLRGDSSLATIADRNGHDHNLPELKSNRLNNCVAAVYGNESSQMAYRYLILGFHYEQNFGDYEQAARCFVKASKIYAKLSDKGHHAEALSFLAFVQYKIGNFDEARRTIHDSLQIVGDQAPVNRSQRNVIKELAGVSLVLGDRDQAKRLWERADAFDRGQQRAAI